jgi:hypothetical protein
VELGFEVTLAKQVFYHPEPHPQSIFLWLFWRWGLVNYLPGLALKHNPPNLIIPSSEDYKHEPVAPSSLQYLIYNVSNFQVLLI